MENDIIQIKDKNGNEVEYNILFSFDSKNTKKHYIVYTDYNKNENEKTIIHTACWDLNSKERKLEKINTEYELSIINKFIQTIEETLNKKI